MHQKVFAVRVRSADGACLDVMLFTTRDQAVAYAERLKPLPLGLESVKIVPRFVIGAIDHGPAKRSP